MILKQALLGYQSLNDIVIYQNDNSITLYQLMEDLIYLDKKLPKHKHLLNLYENRYYFILGLLLGIKRQSIHLFPSNTSAYTFEFLTQEYAEILTLDKTAPQYKNKGKNKVSHIDIESLLKTKKTATQETVEQYLAIFANDAYYHEDTIIIFTSGSTGTPKPFAKKLSDFIAVAQQLKTQLTLENNPMILATVPAQHMYGLETSIMMPLINGLSMYEERPFYPDDMARILAKQTHSSLLVTTPIHIRACLKTQTRLTHLQQVLCATAPLDEQMAQIFEDEQEVSLIEIYGCTEVGVIATRRSAVSQEWICLDDIALVPSSENLVDIQTNRSINVFTLNDHISYISNKTFMLHGRKSDMINIAGKRNSLSYLNHHLLNYKHLSDGCFYQPDHLEESQQRLVVFIVADKHRFSIQDFKHYFKTKVDSVFTPRHFYFVDKLPRNKTGKILHNEIKSLYQKLSINN